MQVTRRGFVIGAAAVAATASSVAILSKLSAPSPEKPADGFPCGHRIGDGKVDDPQLVEMLRDHFNAECCEVGMYLAMSRQAERDGYPEVADAFRRYACDEADHAARIAELLGEVVTDCTRKNVKMRADAEAGACRSKLEIATRAKQLNYDAIHDTVHEMAKDEARHGAGFAGLYSRYFA